MAAALWHTSSATPPSICQVLYGNSIRRRPRELRFAFRTPTIPVVRFASVITTPHADQRAGPTMRIPRNPLGQPSGHCPKISDCDAHIRAAPQGVTVTPIEGRSITVDTSPNTPQTSLDPGEVHTIARAKPVQVQRICSRWWSDGGDMHTTSPFPPLRLWPHSSSNFVRDPVIRPPRRSAVSPHRPMVTTRWNSCGSPPRQPPGSTFSNGGWRGNNL